jgi:glucose/arabinose dehydrogenase
MGLAIDPQFSQNRFVYAAYSYRSAHSAPAIVLSVCAKIRRVRSGIADKILIDDVPGANNHDGGRVKFGPDGKLYGR